MEEASLRIAGSKAAKTCHACSVRSVPVQQQYLRQNDILALARGREVGVDLSRVVHHRHHRLHQPQVGALYGRQAHRNVLRSLRKRVPVVYHMRRANQGEQVHRGRGMLYSSFACVQ